METGSRNRLMQLGAYAAVLVLVFGFFWGPLGLWTGPVLGAWFVGTQKPWTGFIWLLAISVAQHLGGLTGPHAVWLAGALLLCIVPFVLCRLAGTSFLATLALPLWSTALRFLALPYAPADLHATLSPASPGMLAPISGTLGAGASLFLVFWFAAVLAWAWREEFRFRRIALGTLVFLLGAGLIAGYAVWPQLSTAVLPAAYVSGDLFVRECLAGGLVVTALAAVWPRAKQQPWSHRTETIALLRSPFTGAPLKVTATGKDEVLESDKGERFSIATGIPVFVNAAELAGLNRKYHRLYHIVAGLYDDIQRVQCAFRGRSVKSYLGDYLRYLEIAPGNTVLETSVGTGLNFACLPRSLKRVGLDLSADMLERCQENLRRWRLPADLLLGNAERLPFADDSFDVVFHAGGINFFDDRAGAIREMIRVARPGSLILIADETEEHVKAVYERGPLTGRFFRKRTQPVAPPIDLVPPDMQDIRLERLRNGRFYALTFRKPRRDR